MKSFTAKIIFIVVTILALIGESNAQTQTNGRINANDIIEVKQKHEDTQKLIEILGLQKTAKSTFPKIIAALKPQFPQVPDKFWIEFQSESNLQKCVEFYVETYERHFSHEEIRGMLQFYSTPLGKKIILTMPEVMQESMDMGKEMGIALQEQLEREAPVSNEKPSREAIRRQIILNHGLNPDQWDISPDGTTIISKSPPPPKLPSLADLEENQPASAPPPADVHYLVKYGERMCYCREEPKPYGNGFKFKIYPSDVETTVSGNIQIIKLKK